MSSYQQLPSLQEGYPPSAQGYPPAPPAQGYPPAPPVKGYPFPPPPHYSAKPDEYTAPPQPSPYPPPANYSPYAVPPPQSSAFMAPTGTPVAGYPVPEHNARFNYSGHYNDIWASILYGVVILFVVIVAIVFGVQSKSSSGTISSSGSNIPGKYWTIVLLFSFLFTIVVCAAVYQLLKIYPVQFVKGSLWFSAGLMLLGCVVSFFLGYILGGIIFLFLFGITLLYNWLIRHRVAFAAVNLKIAVTFLQDPRFSAIFLILVLTLLVQGAFFVIWCFAIHSVAGSDSSLAGLANLFLVFAYFWTLQVLANVVHVTVAGAFSYWYFMRDADIPNSATTESLKRACGPFFGSICFGSLIIAVIQTLRAVVRGGANQGGNDNAAMQCLRCILACVLKMLEDVFRYVNKYAFTRVAIYGLPYIEAAKQTFQMLSSHGIDAIINDDIISGVTTLAALLGAGLVFLSATILTALIASSYSGWLVLPFIGAAIAFSCVLMTMAVVDSCVASLFVAFADEPMALSFHRPQVWAELQSAWLGRYGDKVRVYFSQV